MPDSPIQIGSQTGEQLGAAIRTLLAAVAGWLTAKGYLNADIATAAIPVVMLAAPLLWSQFRVLKTYGQRATMANLLPDSVAVTK